MKLVFAVMLVRFIISIMVKEKTTQTQVSNITRGVVHPAEFNLR